MNDFTRCFQIGLAQGAFGGMLGFNSWNFNFGCCSNPFAFGTPTPMFFTPSFNFFNTYQYSNPMVNVPFMGLSPMPKMDYSWDNSSIWSNNTNIPDFSKAQDWNKIQNSAWGFDWHNIQLPSSPMNSFGDTFINTTGGDKKSDGTISTDNTGNGDKSSDLNYLKGKHWSKMTDQELRLVYGEYTRDVTVAYKGTAEDLNKYLKGKGVLEGKGEAFIKAQNDYGISAAVLVGICMNESGKGKSNLAKNKNNVGGVRLSGSTEFRKFDKVEDCIDYMAKLLKNSYVNNSGRPLTKLYQINAKYCPASDPTDKTGNNSRWARAVERYSGEVESALA